MAQASNGLAGPLAIPTSNARGISTHGALSTVSTSGGAKAGPPRHLSTGLSTETVQQLRLIHGSNDVELSEQRALWRVFVSKMFGKLSANLISSSITSVAFQNWRSTVFIGFLWFTNAAVATWQERQAHKALAQIRGKFNFTCAVIRLALQLIVTHAHSHLISLWCVPPSETMCASSLKSTMSCPRISFCKLVVFSFLLPIYFVVDNRCIGHMSRLRPGDLVVADCLLLSGRLRVNTSGVTGESEVREFTPVSIEALPTTTDPVPDAVAKPEYILAGSRVKDGAGAAYAVNTGL